MLETHCRVCGLDQLVPPRDENDVPSWLICECCGTEAGYDDANLKGIRSNRTKWLENGAKWFRPKAKPADWNLEEQLKHIAEEFR